MVRGMMNPLDIGGPAFLGMAELEGEDDLVDTFDARFNAALREMKSELAWAGDDEDVTYEVNAILDRHGISPTSLTQKQVNRIERAIS